MSYICINCSYPLPNLYTTYSKADDRTLGKGVRLTQCPNCKRFADKYVEHDYVVLFIDLVLIKPQVYRHLLFNRLNSSTSSPTKSSSITDKLDPSILRLGILLVLFDVYITWARIEKGNDASNTKETSQAASTVLTSWPIVGQYLFFLTLNVVATLAQHFTIRLLAHYILRKKSMEDRHTGRLSAKETSNVRDLRAHSRHTSSELISPASTSSAHPTQALPHPQDSSEFQSLTPAVRHATPSAISTALLVSSCTKLFPILLVIWPTSSSSSAEKDGPFASRAASYISWVVLVNNIEALLILLDCGYIIATGLAMAGMLSRWLVEGWLLGAVGLRRDDGGPIGDLVSLLGW
ncbi:hypothetical protein LTR64_002069 [Lithohypha guttulata]|uniref:uncharacterized protein n=1 Tax=Lithohypha guttulata TaxID=1690604 RepID=UPI002DE14D53|nr:hypothetical protein LTR51_007927 [Lithohypha guttulata]